MLPATLPAVNAPIASTLGGALSPGFDSLVLLLVFLLAVVALVLTFRRLPLAYGAFAMLALLWCARVGQPAPKVQPREGYRSVCADYLSPVDGSRSLGCS